MATQVVIIGGVALGPKVASRLKRCAPEIEVTLLDKDKYISYGGCGIPYYIGGDIVDLKELRSTMYHMERNEEFFEKIKHFKVLTGKKALSIDRKNKKVLYQDVDSGQEEEINYDYLVLGTGSTPYLPPLAGVDLPGVENVYNLNQAEKIKTMLSQGQIEEALIVGGGAIGLEMAEAMTDLWGVETTLVEMEDHLLPMGLGPNMAKMVEGKLKENGVRVLTQTKVTQILGDQKNGVQGVETTQGEISCQLVIFCIGVRSNSDLAAQAGLSLGPNNGIWVDARLRTSDPYIYSGGDCIEQRHLLSGENIVLRLGSLANRQGRVIASNIAGGSQQFPGVISNFCVKVFDFGVARAGLTYEQATRVGFNPDQTLVVQPDRAHFYPTSGLMYITLIADKKTRQILGIEAFGPNGDAVKSRVDAIASLLPQRATLEDISNLEVSYSPPYASAMDIVNVSANVLSNILDDLYKPISPLEFLEAFTNTDCQVLDIRSPNLAQSCLQKYGSRWINIPFSKLPDSLEEIPRDIPVYVYCNTGTTSYEAQRYLNSQGFDNLLAVQGSYAAIMLLAPEFEDPDKKLVF